MARFKSLWRRLTAPGNPDRLHGEIAEEFEFHIEQRTQENIRRGMPAADARREAQRQFGRAMQIQEEGYEARSAAWLESFLQDLAYGLRGLRRNPGFTATAVLTLALGIGVNTAIFSVMESVLFRPLPFPQPDRLVMVRERDEHAARLGVSGPDFDDFQARTRSFDLMAELLGYFTYTWTGGGEPRNLRCTGMSPDFFPALGVQPILGRLYTPEEYHIDGGQAVISEKFWRQQLGADPHVIGRILTLQDTPMVVIGVMPDLPDLYPETDIWAKVVPELEFMHWRQNKFLAVVGRLKQGTTQAQAEAELTGILHGAPGASSSAAVQLVSLRDDLVGHVKTQLSIAMAAVMLVLVIACVNVMYLLLARISGRAAEVALRVSLGAGVKRLLRQFATENLLLVTLGGGLGVVLALALVRMVTRWNLGNLPRGEHIAVHGPVLAFALAIALLVALVLAAAPFTVLRRLTPGSEWKQGRVAAGRPRSFRLLVVSEVSCAVVLLVAAGLLLRSLWLLQHTDPGFEPTRVIATYLRTNFYSTDGAPFYNTLLQRVSQLPGVEAAAVSDCLPGDRAATTTLSFDDRPNDPAHPATADGCWTSTGYFSAIGAPLLQGRLFADRDDAQAAPIVIVNRSLAQKFWPGEKPVGKRIAVNYLGMGRRNTGTVRYREVVGVVGDFKQRALDVPTAPTLYMPFHQDETHHDYSGLNLLVRTAGDPRGAAGSLRTAIHSVRPDQAVGDMFTLSDVLAKGLAPRRFSLLLLGSFAALALALSAIGIYGTIAYSVGQRRREMGVRAAVGASAGDLLIMVMKEGLALIVAGLAMGFALSFFFSRAMSAMLFGISAADAVTLVSSGLLLLAVAAAACFVPARRAASADPMLALRAE